MRRTFQGLQQLLNAIVSESRRQPEFPRRHNKWLARWPFGCHQSEAKKVIDDLFERGSGPPGFLGEQPGNVVIQRKSGAHIMMIDEKAS